MVTSCDSSTITFRELSSYATIFKKWRNPVKKKILNNVSGEISTGELTAIVGPSGSGKTSLLNALAGYRLKNVRGTVLLDGTERTIPNFRKLVSYSLQTDYFLLKLTVEETIHIAAELRMNPHSMKSKADKVREIITSLSLKSCSKTLVSHLSGGEIKRLSIAVELVHNPLFMFFDEPMSGLDSVSCIQCFGTLKALTKDGRGVVCSVHQPTSRLFEEFDRIIVMSEGKCIFTGHRTALLDALKHLGCPQYYNPVDYVIEIACGMKDDLGVRIEEFSETLEGIDTSLPKVKVIADNHESFGNLSFPGQVAVLFKRNIKTTFREQFQFHLRLVTHVMTGLIVGILYYGKGNQSEYVLHNVGLLFFIIMFLVFTSMMPNLITFPHERCVTLREQLNSWYSLHAYYVAKCLVDIPFQILYSLIFVVIVYLMSSQPMVTFRFAYFLLASCLLSLISESWGLFIGAVCHTAQEAIFIGPATVIPGMLFSGFFLPIPLVPEGLSWLSYLSHVRYAFESFILSVYGFNRENLECSEGLCLFQSPDLLLAHLDMEETSLLMSISSLAIFLLVLRTLCFFGLKWKINRCLQN